MRIWHYLQVLLLYNQILMLSKYKNPNNSQQTFYLLPQSWWLALQPNFLNSNLQVSQNINIIENLKLNILKLECFIETLQKSIKQQIIDKVSQKLNYIHIDNFTLNPKLKTNTKWKIISEAELKKIQAALKDDYNYVSFPFLLKNQQINKQNILQINDDFTQEPVFILLCSNSQNHLYMGYHKKNQLQIQNLKNLINFLGYEETERTRIVFPEQNILRKFKLQDLNMVNHSSIMMICDLRRFDQIVLLQAYQQFQKGLYFLPQHLLYENHYEMRSRLNEEDQITMADLDSESRVISEHTLSTGAQTPSFTSFLLDELDQRPFRTHNLFGQKKPEQIQIMREYAREVIHNQLIQIKDKEDIEFQLQKIAEQIQQTLYKKRYCKDTKDFRELHSFKECFQNFHHFAHNKQQNEQKNYQ